MQNQPFFTPNHETVTSMAILEALICPRLFLILHLHQTTTQQQCWHQHKKLFLILHLHQTTTSVYLLFDCVQLFLILHLHQTTTLSKSINLSLCCFLSCIYIKPQLLATCCPFLSSCFLSCIYIKPQLFGVVYTITIVVSYLASTSNHNNFEWCILFTMLFLILHLHQTTTTKGEQLSR